MKANEERAFFEFVANPKMLVVLEPDGLVPELAKHAIINNVVTLETLLKTLEEHGAHEVQSQI